MLQKRALIQLIPAWVQEYWLFVIGTAAVLIPLVFWTARPISSAIFRLYAQDCGSVLSRSGIQPSQQGIKAQQTEHCFWQAHQQCHAALLMFTEMGVDTGVRHTFATENHFGTCSLSDEAESYGLIRSRTTRYTCSGLVERPDGLHFLACGDEGEIIVSGT